MISFFFILFIENVRMIHWDSIISVSNIWVSINIILNFSVVIYTVSIQCSSTAKKISSLVSPFLISSKLGRRNIFRNNLFLTVMLYL